MDDDTTTSGSEPAATTESTPAPRTLRQGVGRRSRVGLALALAGLSLVPIAGTVYVVVADFGPSGEDEAAASGSAARRQRAPAGGAADEGLDDADDAGEPSADPRARSRSGAAANRPRSFTEPRTDGAAECCAALRELGKTAKLEQRASFLAAATACDAAPSEERAFKQARSILGSSRVDLPEACAGE